MISGVRLHSLPGDMVFDELEHADRLRPSTLEGWNRSRVLIASPQPIVRHGLRALLTAEPDFDVVAETDNGAAAVALARQLRPDVVLIDLKVAQVDGITVTRLIRAESSDTQVVVMAGIHDDTRAIEAIRAGASACLHNGAPTDVYLRTIRDVSVGHVSLPSQLAERLMRVVDRQEVLSERETQVLRLVASGKSNKLIARELVIAESTVKSHVGSVLNKLGLESRTQLALHAARTGLVALDQPGMAM